MEAKVNNFQNNAKGSNIMVIIYHFTLLLKKIIIDHFNIYFVYI